MTLYLLLTVGTFTAIQICVRTTPQYSMLPRTLRIGAKRVKRARSSTNVLPWH